MYLESLMHTSSSFVTLTYNEASLSPAATLVPRDVTLWLKKLRRRVHPLRIRYYLCGEYGEITQRPHYHACLFGIGVEHTSSVTTSWEHGFVMCSEFNEKTAQYSAGYVTKKMTKASDYRLNGRFPEFARMSKNPGLGVPALPVIAAALKDMRMNDVPHVLMLGKRRFPLARFLRMKLRDLVGPDEDGVVPSTAAYKADQKLEMLSLFKAALARRASGDTAAPLTVGDALVELNQGRLWSVESKYRVQHSRRTL